MLLDQKWCTELLSELVNSNETVTVVNVSLVDVSLWKRNGKKLNVSTRISYCTLANCCELGWYKIVDTLESLLIKATPCLVGDKLQRR